MNKEEYKKRIKQEFEKRNLNGFANHTILADLMADICTDVVKENCNLPVVMPRFNVNHYATVYPNAKGWQKIIDVTAENYCVSKETAKEIVDRKCTEENAYRDQLWCIMSELHSMYFNGQNYFDSSFMFLENGA